MDLVQEAIKSADTATATVNGGSGSVDKVTGAVVRYIERPSLVVLGVVSAAVFGAVLYIMKPVFTMDQGSFSLVRALLISGLASGAVFLSMDSVGLAPS